LLYLSLRTTLKT